MKGRKRISQPLPRQSSSKKASTEKSDTPTIDEATIIPAYYTPDLDRKKVMIKEAVPQETSSSNPEKEKQKPASDTLKIWKMISSHSPKPKKKPQKNVLPTTASCFEELPSEWQKKIISAKIDVDSANKKFYELLCILHCITKESFRMKDGTRIPNSEPKSFTSPQLREMAINMTVKMDKVEVKKLYRTNDNTGKGGFGKVFCCKDLKTKETVAVKRLPHTKESEIESNYGEIGCLLELKHSNVVDFKKALLVGENEIWIVTEYMEGGTLCEALRVHTVPLKEYNIGYISREILKGLAFIHEKQFAHRDIKSGNVMLSVSGNVKIIDVGLCADFSECTRVQTVGTSYWMSPEIITKKPHSLPTDIWSFGILFVEMFLRDIPFGSSKLVSMWKAVNGDTLSCLNKLNPSASAIDFAKSALVVNTADRATAAQLLKHPFISGDNLEGNIKDVLKKIFVSITLSKSGI